MTDQWPDLCRLVEQDDCLPTRKAAGTWTETKLYFWHRYIDLTTQAMFGKPQWPAGLIYVDLFAGPGICKSEKSGKRFPGSPLIAAHTRKPFSQIILCELEQENVDACAKRLDQSPAKDRFKIIHGDCNERIQEITSAVPRGALTLAFVDPTGLDVHFETLEELSHCGRVDLLILFADAVDASRNWRHLYMGQENSKLDRMLGEGSDWRKHLESLTSQDAFAVRKELANIYENQLRNKLGYKVFGRKTMYMDVNLPIYILLYASKHERGLEFWEKVTLKEPSGQRSWF